MATPLKKLNTQQDANRQTSPLPLREKIDNIITKAKASPKKFSQRGLSQTSKVSKDYYVNENLAERTDVINSANQIQSHHFYLNIKDIPKDKPSQQKSNTLSLSSSIKAPEGAQSASKDPYVKLSQNPSLYVHAKYVPTSRKNSLGVETYRERNTHRNEAVQPTQRGAPARKSGTIGDELNIQREMSAVALTARESYDQHAQISDRLLVASKPTSSAETKHSEPQSQEKTTFKQSSSPKRKPQSETAPRKESQFFENSDFISSIKENLKFVTCCREHGNQPLTLFNPITKQLACVQCVYQQKQTIARKNNFMSSQHAFSQLADHTKFFKLEAQEKIFDIEKHLQACKSNIKTQQENLRFYLKAISQEFEELRENLKQREMRLIESIQSASETQINNLIMRKENLQYLKNCYQDAKEVDPSSTVEQCVHFYAVFNMLKNAMKSIGLSTEQLGQDHLDSVEFPNNKEIRNTISKYGKVKASRSQAVGNFIKQNRVSVGNFFAGARKSPIPGNQLFERGTPSPIRGRDITPSKSKELSPQPTLSYLERESLRNKFKVQSILESQQYSHLKYQPKPNITRSTPVSARKHQQNSTSHLLNDTSDSNRAEEDIPSSMDFARKQSEPLNILQENWNQAGNSQDKLEEKVRAHSTAEFKAYLKYSDQYNEKQMQADDYRNFHRDRSDVNDYSNYEQVSPKNYETVSFKATGTLHLFQDSKIIIDDEIKYDLISIFREQVQDTKLLYRLSEDGPNSEVFHSKCDGKAPILALVYANRHYVFGYYLPVPLEKEDKYVICDDSFLFSLRNPELAGPLVFPIKKDKKFIAVYQSTRSPCLGSTILNKQDLWIQIDEPNKSCSNIGYAYRLPNGIGGSVALAGQFTDWQVQEIEFFKISF